MVEVIPEVGTKVLHAPVAVVDLPYDEASLLEGLYVFALNAGEPQAAMFLHRHAESRGIELGGAQNDGVMG